MLQTAFIIIATLVVTGAIFGLASGPASWFERPAAVLSDVGALCVAVCGVVMGVILLGAVH